MKAWKQRAALDTNTLLLPEESPRLKQRHYRLHFQTAVSHLGGSLTMSDHASFVSIRILDSVCFLHWVSCLLSARVYLLHSSLYIF